MELAESVLLDSQTETVLKFRPFINQLLLYFILQDDGIT